MTGRQRRPSRDPDREASAPPSSPAPAPPPTFQPAVPGLLTCGKCGALLVDAETTRRVHVRFHAGLATLWASANGGT